MTRTAAVTHAIPSVGAVLAPIHDCWTRQVRSFLAPATDIHAGFWSRWGAARYLGDQFDGHFRLEGALADELGPLIAPEAVARLDAARTEVEHTRAALMEVGRRRGVARLTAALAHRFMEGLNCWWGELESATAQLDPRDLPAEAGRLLDRLQIAGAVAE
jgi:hypothetical protein